MVIQHLFTDPLSFLSFVIAVVIGVSVHEFSHALAAFLQGDPTAKNAGRLTLNPVKHFTLMGTLFLLFFGFGWGRPVPYNPHNLKNPKYGPLFVGLAGPFSNFIMVALFSFLLRSFLAFNIISPISGFIQLFSVIIYLNAILMIFNLLPIPPLDGSSILFSFLPARYHNFEILLIQYGVWVLLGLILLGGLDFILSGGTYLVLKLFGVAGIITGF